MLLSQLMPKIGLEIGSDQLTSAISTIVLIAGALWTLYQRHQRGDITMGGFRR